MSSHCRVITPAIANECGCVNLETQQTLMVRDVLGIVLFWRSSQCSAGTCPPIMQSHSQIFLKAFLLFHEERDIAVYLLNGVIFIYCSSNNKACQKILM